MTSRLWSYAVSIRPRRQSPIAAAAAGAALAAGLHGVTPVYAALPNGGAGAPSLRPGAPAARAPRPAHARRSSYSGLPLAQVQRVLGVAADGAWGSSTARALRRWQVRHGLGGTGVTDTATVRSLGLDPWSDPPLPVLTAAAADAMTAPTAAVRAELAKIARCESGGDVHQLSYHGTYRGKYQFDMESWFRAGGLLDPAQAPESEQTRRAGWILATQGRSAWPSCS